jgi:hypothetical protein
MQFHLYKVSGYEEAIMSLRMSQSKYYSWEKAQHIQDLVYVCTDKNGFLAQNGEYRNKLAALGIFAGVTNSHPKIKGIYNEDIAEFKRLLGMTKNNAMVEFDHHTLMKYIDISFFTDGLHRGAQDDLDAHAQRFNNRITRFSTRLAEISEPEVSEWYEGKIITFDGFNKMLQKGSLEYVDWAGGVRTASPEEWGFPDAIFVGDDKFKYTPFGYVLEKYADMSEKNGLRKDVFRGLVNLGHPGAALWKIDLHELRYVYFRRSKLTKANPELRAGMEQLANQIEANIPIFGEHFRYQFTDTCKWEHINKVRTVTAEEYAIIQEYNKLKHN